MKKKLLAGEAMMGLGGDIGLNSWIMTQREWAADILLQVSHETEIGSYPQHISAFDLGRAVGRALSNNNNDEDPMGELVRGYTHYLSVKRISKK